MRYLILIDLPSFANTAYFETLEKHRMNFRILTYGTRLLNYFMNQSKLLIDQICTRIENGFITEAIVADKNVFNPCQVSQLECVNLKREMYIINRGAINFANPVMSGGAET
jgi:hypothetical protein